MLFLNHISVVTCNKIANSRSDKEFRRLRETHRAMEVRYLYETNVGAGLPIIRTLSDLYTSGDEILKIEAILSGTISFLFNHYTPDRTFAEVVREAQDRGYTEPDPRDDLSGMDFRRKMLILGRILGNSLEIEDIQMDPILPEACMKAASVDAFYKELEKAEPHFSKLRDQALSKGHALRCIGYLDNSGKKKRLSVRVSEVDASHPFYMLGSSDNVIAIQTKRYHETPLVIKGPGAGAAVTAAGVFSDLIRIGTT
jgi:aspartokinase/homoserine dehydrogenase 1